ncbi:MAG: geranylgeranyl reductase [Candidatus Methanoperedens nitroreducens]|uniref:Geranylgeranyl reductase n=1 Tax=Candidatus Methanoperedens nitratireducens TaxID=1392998 RepID=A0A0P8CIP5_9EURY|nr:geranylgeranyl reductase family protein [Candidatus Methanoperedens sp. BLZ2]KPQ42725.1 MAG: geranylgeranyl reductase [Candidatus Methanoperedens sp. BLZ1]MBZ0176220.1 geranylgeranyl reductase family protein [Candidatus Methanoperedens nitroreducens]MCX9077446.1 geranylgeranyl reductase family protein [Candidatus Methanoperedens sp.]CAG1002443.1 Menaquinone reductase [Methanosarcinales archaeon]MCX9089166.1 geranylgeranyl reductase family protein [Candidatus Methanoperedens sp.]
MKYDAIVAGLGPAGATAAYEISKKGFNVLALDKQKHPRYKPCGGGLTAKIEKILEPDFKSVVERIIYKVNFTYKGTGDIRAVSRHPIVYMVMRDVFDNFLVEKARAAGAEIHEQEKVTHVEEEKDSVIVMTEKNMYSSKLLIGADGVNGIVARSLGLKPKKRTAVLIEGEVKVKEKVFNRVSEEIQFDFGSVPYGYGWIFPKADHLSLGVGGLKEMIKNPKPYYSGFLSDQYILDDIESERKFGYTIPIFDGESKIAGFRTMLVGDAAALVDPFLAEGIYYAVRSGQIAAEVASAVLHGNTTTASYHKRIAQEIYPEFQYARKIGMVFYTFPKLGYELLKRYPEFYELIFDIVRGEASYEQLLGKMKSKAGIEILAYLGLLKTRPRDVRETYDSIADQYDSYAFFWKNTMGKGVWKYFEEMLKENIKDGATILDAGTGTGEAIKAILKNSNPSKVVGIDISKGMLKIAREKIKDKRVSFEVQDISTLPYPDNSFDVVTSTWALETLKEPKKTVTEFLRVINEDGYVIYVFHSLPNNIMGRLYSYFMKQQLKKKYELRLLTPKERPFHKCGRSSIASFAGGLVTVVVLRKCCSVTDETAPCLIGEEEIPNS